ncbi:DUF2637 domain-containing protein [Nocardia africana]|uniref:Protein of uncharacterized function (DUF2637) n=1 Tax=Nocardia africana TaxID=134964 RepID=A0A378WJP5_9NOCA|nr:DUF2637 domain-containing protein [Nocardia africana]MCC3316502.1 DUF2637 domain-containing protein [Nocardia africana]SUA41142.1 Protein of uncharacterised function (DUF2637) [Nocardia africana]
MFTPERGMRAARVFAVLVIVGVGAAAFRLSFATLRDLAKLAHIPSSDAWLFPLIIDGTIVQATAGALVLAKSPERKFFTWVLVVGALVSVAGNSIHAVAAGKELPAWLCAIVAAIAPISLLVDTHGLAVLFRAAQQNPAPTPATDVVMAEAEEDAPAAAKDSEPAAPEIPVPAPVVPSAPAVAHSIPVSRPVQPPLLPVSVPVGS